MKSRRLSTSTVPRTAQGQIIPMERVTVASWSPGEPGEGVPPTQVHLLMYVAGSQFPIVARFKSAEAVNALIDALRIERDATFGEGGEA